MLWILENEKDTGITGFWDFRDCVTLRTHQERWNRRLRGLRGWIDGDLRQSDPQAPAANAAGRENETRWRRESANKGPSILSPSVFRFHAAASPPACMARSTDKSPQRDVKKSV